MKGKELRDMIKRYSDKTGISALEIISKSGIKQRTYYDLFDKEEVEAFYLDKLASIGIPVRNIAEVITEEKRDH